MIPFYKDQEIKNASELPSVPWLAGGRFLITAQVSEFRVLFPTSDH